MIIKIISKGFQEDYEMAVKEKKMAAAEAAVETAAAKKTAARKTSAKKTEVLKEEAVKTEAPKEEALKEEPAKKPAVKKAPAKKAEPAATVTIQFNNRDVAAKDVLEAAKKAYMEANPDGEIKTIDIYVKPEENVAYYVVNGEGSGDYKIQL